MRRNFGLPAGVPPAIVAYHDQDIDVYLNGILAANASGYTHSYDVLPISNEAFGGLKAQGNVLAVLR